MKQQIIDSYGLTFEPALIDEIAEVATVVNCKAGEVIIDYEQNLRGMPLILEGAIKVLRQDPEGDELALYYLEKGDVCAMTMTCCMGQKKSTIRAVAEIDTSFLNIPVQKMKAWTKQYDTWMAYVFESYNNRFNEFLTSIDNLAFSNMHERILKYLKDLVIINKTTLLNVSHQSIAYDMHTSRVVVSRLLKGLEKEGVIKLGRNKIEILKF